MGSHAETVAQLVANVSMDRIKRHVEIFSEHIGPRPAGSTAERNAAVYVFNELESYGLRPEFVEYSAYIDRPVTCRLEVLQPQRRHLISESLAWGANTGPSGIVADIIDGGHGSASELEALGAAIVGKVVLARAGRVWRGSALRHAQDHGAAGLIWVSSYPEAPITNLGMARIHYGNPLPESEQPKLPGVAIRYEDGELIADQVRLGAVTVRIEVYRDREYVPSQNVVANLPGTRYPDQLVSMGAHVDNWSGGAYDSGSQLAGMLEIARALAVGGTRPERSIQFCGWGAHEHGIIGSIHHAYESHSDDVEKRMVGHVNCCPIIGGRGQSRASLRTNTSVEIRHLTEELVARYGWSEGWTDISPYWDGSDHIGFFLRGVPTCQPRGWYVGSGNPFYHSVAGDTYRNVWFDEDNIRDAIRLHAGLALFLANGPVPPLRYAPVARELRREVEAVRQLAGDIVDFAPLLDALHAMEDAAAMVSGLIDDLLEPRRSPETLSDHERSALEHLSEPYVMHGKRLATALYSLTHVRLGSQLLEGESGEQIGLIPAFLEASRLRHLSPSSSEHNRLKDELAQRARDLAAVVDPISAGLRDEAVALQTELSLSVGGQ